MTTPDRFWDVLVTADDGWYDFAGAITLQADYTARKMRAKHPDTEGFPGTPTIAVQGPIPTVKGIILAGDLPDPLPPLGYVASPIKICDIRGATPSPEAARLVRWVSDTSHVGKIRVNCHGDPAGGMMFMKSPHRMPSVCFFSFIAYWLAKNGLQDVVMPRHLCRKLGLSPGLSTITLAACHSAKRREETAGKETRSGVEQLVQELKQLGHEGIEVTGHVAPFTSVLSDVAVTNLAAEDAMTKVDEMMKQWMARGWADDDALAALVADAIARTCDDLSFDRKSVHLSMLSNDPGSAKDVFLSALTECTAATLRKSLRGDGLTPGQIAVSGDGDRWVRFAHLPTKTKMIL